LRKDGDKKNYCVLNGAYVSSNVICDKKQICFFKDLTRQKGKKKTTQA
jgi:hypothetical protein